MQKDQAEATPEMASAVEDSSSIRRKALGRVRVPATILVLYGFAHVVLIPLKFASDAFRALPSLSFDPAQATGLFVVLAIFFVKLGLALICMVAGTRMLGAKSRGMVEIGAIAACLPWTGFCCIGAPVGIWVIMILQEKNVRLAFLQPTR